MRSANSIAAGWMPMRKYQIAVLDDYQNVALESADWSVLRDRADIAVFQNHLADPDAVIERLLPFDVVCVMRERTPLPRNVIERLPWRRRISATYRMVFTRRSTRIPSRMFGIGSTRIRGSL